jgi:hypothetical protein
MFKFKPPSIEPGAGSASSGGDSDSTASNHEAQRLTDRASIHAWLQAVLDGSAQPHITANDRNVLMRMMRADTVLPKK